ncbi:MAG: hypothetical protein K2J51_07295 [Alistipes sp.]|nr:hypothetical protein [Alistipes sp.]MDE6779252.1 hypothetical protein [Alistipes sp.]MDE6858693.1 hypothetical protein [Alistipes sp.]
MKASTQRTFGILITVVAVLLAITEAAEYALGAADIDAKEVVCAAAGIFGGVCMWYEAARRLKEEKKE